MNDDINVNVHDTLNLDEIKSMIEERPAAAETVQEEPEAEKPEKKSLLAELYDMLHDLIYILAAVTLIFVFFVRLVGVEGDSMLPTLHNRDFLLLESNFLYTADDISRGDIVVLNVPYYWDREERLIVKRVIATEGQTVDIDYEANKVYVDGVCLEEDYINEADIHRLWRGDTELSLPATVPQGHIFVLGDNRNNSSDSRYAPVGMIDERCVLGKAWAIALPGQTRDNYGNVLEDRDWSRIGLVS